MPNMNLPVAPRKHQQMSQEYDDRELRELVEAGLNFSVGKS